MKQVCNQVQSSSCYPLIFNTRKTELIICVTKNTVSHKAVVLDWIDIRKGRANTKTIHLKSFVCMQNINFGFRPKLGGQESLEHPNMVNRFLQKENE